MSFFIDWIETNEELEKLKQQLGKNISDTGLFNQAMVDQAIGRIERLTPLEIKLRDFYY
jgi:ribosome assembly protein YihI (activator of Der GTPase)